MHQIGVELLNVLEFLLKQVDEGSIDPFGLWRMTTKNCTKVFVEYFCYLFGVFNNQNK